MTKRVYKKLFLLTGIISLFFIAGCSDLGFGTNQRCTVGDNCRYYEGTQGVTMRVDNPPTLLNYYQADQSRLEGNMVEINAEVWNEGASDARGAVYLHGIDPNLWDIRLLTGDGRLKNRVQGLEGDRSCFFNIRSGNINLDSTEDFIYSLPLNFRCGGTSITTGQGSISFGTGLLQEALERLGVENAPDVNVGFDKRQDGGWNFNVDWRGGQVQFLRHGRLLVTLLDNIRWQHWFGHDFLLAGNHPDNPGGERDYKRFEVELVGGWPHGQDQFRQDYQLTSCYGYTTFVSPMICVDRDPQSAETKVCRAQRLNWEGSQGGPVAVTSVDQTTTRNEVIMDITVENRGTGTVWDPGHLERCSPYYPGRVRPSMKNNVYVGQAIMGGQILDCTGQEVRLDPNTERAQFTCGFDLTEAADVGSGFETPLRMELWYGYSESVQRSFTVRRR